MHCMDMDDGDLLSVFFRFDSQPDTVPAIPEGIPDDDVCKKLFANQLNLKHYNDFITKGRSNLIYISMKRYDFFVSCSLFELIYNTYDWC